jgi:predicted alpha/beta hydrolase family esterase
MTQDDIDREARRMAEGSAVVYGFAHDIITRVSGCGLPLSECGACRSAVEAVSKLVNAVKIHTAMTVAAAAKERLTLSQADALIDEFCAASIAWEEAGHIDHEAKHARFNTARAALRAALLGEKP